MIKAIECWPLTGTLDTIAGVWEVSCLPNQSQCQKAFDIKMGVGAQSKVISKSQLVGEQAMGRATLLEF